MTVIYRSMMSWLALKNTLQPPAISKEIKSLKLGKAFGFDGIGNECLRHLSKRPVFHLTYLFYHCRRLDHFLASWKRKRIITLPKPGKDRTISPNLESDQPLLQYGQIIWFKNSSKTHWNGNLLNASQFGFQANHSWHFNAWEWRTRRPIFQQ
jgi:hypothetical protein